MMKKITNLIAIVCVAFPIGLAQAAPSSNLAWTVENKRLVDAGDAEHGKKIETIETEKSNACTDCHGNAGAEPDRDKHPMLAGQLATYTYKQLKDYQDGSRNNRRMRKAVEDLSDADLAALSAWYAEQPFPEPEIDPDVEISDSTIQLVFSGDKKRLIQPCASCHGERGEGSDIDVPALAGQNARYFRDTMKSYKKGKRKNDVYSRMRIIAEVLTDDEIEQLAEYYVRQGRTPHKRSLVDELLAKLWGDHR